MSLPRRKSPLRKRAPCGEQATINAYRLRIKALFIVAASIVARMDKANGPHHT